MPRRYYEYPERFQALNVASTAGASLLAIGLIIVAIYLVYALAYGERAEANPWRSKGYEWLTASPPPTHNFVGPQPVYPEEPHLYVEPKKAEVPDAV
jgi:cytochrome c oxidase subunit 1